MRGRCARARGSPARRLLQDRRNKATKSAAVQGTSAATGAKDRSQGVSKALTSFIDPALCWADIKWFKSITRMKIVLKGIQARQAPRTRHRCAVPAPSPAR